MSGAPADLGDLSDFSGEEQVPEYTFGWFGTQMRVHPDLSDTAFIDWVEEIDGLDAKDPKAVIAVKNFMRIVVHADDFDEFWRLGRAHRVGQEKFAAVAHKLIEMVAGRPTGRSSDSQPGPPATAASSTDDSYKRVIEAHEKEGRPDLALVYVEAQEAGVAQRAS